MGCKPSKQKPRVKESVESVRAANIRAMENNKKRGKDAMGHDKDIPRATPGTPEFSLLQRQKNRTSTMGMASAAASAMIVL